jgi:DUF971 family protein
MKPVKVQRLSPSELRVEWDDGHQGRHTMAVLRKYCPCAACKSERDANDGPALLPIVVPGKNELQGVEPVGSYALQLSWVDGHRTGIYTYDYLRQICECERCAQLTAE